MSRRHRKSSHSVKLPPLEPLEPRMLLSGTLPAPVFQFDYNTPDGVFTEQTSADSAIQGEVDFRYTAWFATENPPVHTGGWTGIYDGGLGAVEISSSTYGDHLDNLTQLTMSAWIKAEAFDGDGGLNDHDYIMGFLRYEFYLDKDGNLGFDPEGNKNHRVESSNANMKVQTQEWTFIAVTFDYSTKQATFYKGTLDGNGDPVINSQTVTSTTSATSSGSPYSHVALGRRHQASSDGGGRQGTQNGLLDNISLYDQALSSSQIEELMMRNDSPNPTLEPIAEWHFDELPGADRTRDDSGRAFDGKLVNFSNLNTAWVNGHLEDVPGHSMHPGSALDMQGTGNYVTFDPVLDPHSESYSVGVWFNRENRTSGSREVLASKGNTTVDHEGWSIYLDENNRLVVRASDGGSAAAAQIGPTVNDDAWHQVTMVIDRETGQIVGYLDGSNDGWSDGDGDTVSSNSIAGWGTILNRDDSSNQDEWTVGAAHNFYAYDRAQRTIDGAFGTSLSSVWYASGDPIHQSMDWIEYDLGSSQTVAGIGIAGDDDPDAFDVRYWNGSEWVVVLSQISSTLENQIEVFNFPSSVTTSKIQLNNFGSKFARISEVEIYGGTNGTSKRTISSVSSTGFEGERVDYYQGKVDQIAVYDYALSDGQAAHLFNAHHHRPLPHTPSNPSGQLYYWKFDGNDYPFDGHPETFAHNITYETGKHGQAAHFDEVNDSIDLGSLYNLQHAPNDSYTMMMWTRVDSGGRDHQIQPLLGNSLHSDELNGFYLGLGDDSNRNVIFRTGVGDKNTDMAVSTTQTLAVDTWYHIAVTVDRANGQAEIFIDGQPAGSGSIRTDFTLSGPVFAGATAGNEQMSGEMDELRIFGSELTQTQIADYASSTFVPESNDSGAPSTPSGLAADYGDRWVDLSWSANTENDLAYYNLYRNENGGSYSLLKTDVRWGDYVDYAVVNGITYGYKVTAVDLDGNESAQSSAVTATPGGGGGSVLLADNFDDGDYAGWTVASGSWTAASGELVHNTNVIGALIYWNDSAALSWSDYTVEVDMRATDDDQSGVAFGLQDANNYYRYTMDQGGQDKLEKVVNGTATTLASTSSSLVQNQDYAIKIVWAANGDITVSVDGTPQFGGAVNDTTFTAGTVGFYNKWQRDAIYDDLVVTSNSAAGPLVDESFDSGDGGFTYVDDAFRGTSQASYASGQHTSTGGYGGTGALQVSIGGVNGNDINDMSGAYSTTITLTQAATIEVSFRYRLDADTSYDSGEYSEVLFGVDSGSGVTLYGSGGNDYVHRIGGGADSGWQTFTTTVSLSAGTHTLYFGGYNNQKTTTSEVTNIYFDDLLVDLV